MLKAGEQLGHYRIVSKIGAGGKGEVYLTEDTKLEVIDFKMLPAVSSESNKAAELRSVFFVSGSGLLFVQNSCF